MHGLGPYRYVALIRSERDVRIDPRSSPRRQQRRDGGDDEQRDRGEKHRARIAWRDAVEHGCNQPPTSECQRDAGRDSDGDDAQPFADDEVQYVGLGATPRATP
jgi:hypothetical protein